MRRAVTSCTILYISCAFAQSMHARCPVYTDMFSTENANLSLRMHVYSLHENGANAHEMHENVFTSKMLFKMETFEKLKYRVNTTKKGLETQ